MLVILPIVAVVLELLFVKMIVQWVQLMSACEPAEKLPPSITYVALPSFNVPLTLMPLMHWTPVSVERSVTSCGLLLMTGEPWQPVKLGGLMSMNGSCSATVNGSSSAPFQCVLS